jgi:ABC-type antimicrobial peptide transport system permease subunit
MINYRENLSMALDTIMSHKFRSFLTILGIVVGILTVIVIASILTGVRRSVVTLLEDYGTNTIFAFHLETGIQIGRRSQEEMTRKPLTTEDAQAIKQQCPSVRDVSWWAFPYRTRVQIQYKGKSLRNSNFIGAPSNYVNVATLKLSNGRFYTEVENAHRMSVAILGPDACEAMFDNADPVGKSILVQGHPFTVLGVVEKSKTGFLGSDTDSAVIIPYGTFRKLMPWEDWHFFFIQAQSGKLSQALDETESLLRRKRGVKPSESSNFSLSTADRYIQQFDSITATMGLIAIAISSVGLLVGGIGVMNIMLVSVTERTREIGIRKAIGATKQDIVLQFLFEAMTLTGVGGVFGIILAFGASFLIVAFLPSLPTVIPMWSVITGLSVSVAIGLIFGVWPARKAALLDPIEALRYE